MPFSLMLSKSAATIAKVNSMAGLVSAMVPAVNEKEFADVADEEDWRPTLATVNEAVFMGSEKVSDKVAASMFKEKATSVGTVVSVATDAACKAALFATATTWLLAISRMRLEVKLANAVACEVNKLGFSLTWFNSCTVRVAVICRPLLPLVLAGATVKV